MVADQGGFGTGGFGTGTFGSGGFNTGSLNSETLNETPAPAAEQAKPRVSDYLGLTPTPDSQPGPATRILTGEDPSSVLADRSHAPEPVREIPPSEGTPPIFGGGEPPQPDPSAVSGKVIIGDGSHRPVVYDSLTVSEPTFRTIDRAVVTLHVRGLIDAFKEIEEYHPQRNVPQPPLWKDDTDYLADIKALLEELRRLSALLEAGKTPNAQKVEESGGAIAYAAKRISDGAYDTLGKGLGYAILGSLGVLAYQLGASSDVVQLIMSSTKGGK